MFSAQQRMSGARGIVLCSPQRGLQTAEPFIDKSYELRKAERQAGKDSSGRQTEVLCLRVTKIPTLYRAHQQQRCLRLQRITKRRNMKLFL